MTSAAIRRMTSSPQPMLPNTTSAYVGKPGTCHAFAHCSIRDRCDGEVDESSGTYQLHGRFLTDLARLDRDDEFVGVTDRPISHPGDDVTFDDAGLLSRSTGSHIGDFGARGGVIDDRASIDADVRVTHLPGGYQGLRDLGDIVDRDGEAESDGSAALAADGRVDADHTALGIDEGATGVTRVDCGIGLDGVDDRVGVGALARQSDRAIAR